MKKRLLPLLVMPACAMANPGDMIMLMDALCMATDGEIHVIEKMVLARGGKALPVNVVNSDVAAARFGGKGYTLTIHNKKYAVMATTKGACSVLGQGVSVLELKKRITSNFPVMQPDEDSSGVQDIMFWKVEPPSRYQGGLIMLNAAKKGFGVDGAVSIGFLPRKLVNK